MVGYAGIYGTASHGKRTGYPAHFALLIDNFALMNYCPPPPLLAGERAGVKGFRCRGANAMRPCVILTRGIPCSFRFPIIQKKLVDIFKIKIYASFPVRAQNQMETAAGKRTYFQDAEIRFAENMSPGCDVREAVVGRRYRAGKRTHVFWTGYCWELTDPAIEIRKLLVIRGKITVPPFAQHPASPIRNKRIQLLYPVEKSCSP